jgi:hypothetical protein
MPLKLSVGLSRKQGLPNFGSAGATCLVEMELSFDALREHGEAFFEQAETALAACRTVVEGELARHAPLGATSTAASPTTADPLRQQSLLASPSDSDASNYRERPTDRPATPRQLQAIERLSLKLGAHAGDWLFERIGETPPHCLSLAEASALIDELQQELQPHQRIAG